MTYSMADSASKTLTIGLSPCPNDTFIFYGLLHDKVSGLPFEPKPFIRDVEELNSAVLQRRLAVSKVSFSLLFKVAQDYVLLDSGSALGWGCGPLIVARPDFKKEMLPQATVAIPGIHTTAALLLRLYQPDVADLQPMFFARIPEEVARGRVDAGVIIHESRFTYEALGLQCLVDLGKWWEDVTGAPIPLGGIIAHKNIGKQGLDALDRGLYSSVKYALDHPDEPMDFVNLHAQETDPEVIKKHIKLYVNDFTLSLGENGAQAVKKLFELSGYSKDLLIWRSQKEA